MKSKKRINRNLMQVGEEVFWDQIDSLSGVLQDRYMVIDKKKQTVVVNNAKLTKNLKAIKV